MPRLIIKDGEDDAGGGGEEFEGLSMDEVFDAKKMISMFEKDVSPELRAIIEKALQSAIEDVGENWDELETDFDKELDSLIDESSAKVTESVETVKTELRELLQKMKNHELSEVEDAINAKFEQYGKGRAAAIARTTSTYANCGSQTKAWDKLGVDSEWLSSRDADVRLTHRNADMSRRDKNGLFHVGADKMKHPCAGSIAKENVNCRCGVAPVAKTEKQFARLWLKYMPHLFTKAA